MKLHYVFGMAKDFGGKPWSWIHYMSIRTAAAVHPAAEIVMWLQHEPAGQWWDAARPYLTVRKITAPDSIFGRPLVHPAHRADVVRLEALICEGGVYMDSDVWCLRPFDELKDVPWWMARQGESYGLCNATMGGRPGAPFATRWLERYDTFRSKGRDRYWDEHSVRLPLQLALAHADDITILPSSRCFEPSWTRIREIFKPRRRRQYLDDSLSVHLWESKAWEFLKRLGPGVINPTSEIGGYLQELDLL